MRYIIRRSYFKHAPRKTFKDKVSPIIAYLRRQMGNLRLLDGLPDLNVPSITEALISKINNESKRMKRTLTMLG